MPRRVLLLPVAMVMVLFGVLPAASGSRAQQAITVQSDQPRNEFPAGVTFTLTFTAPSAPKEVRLNYELAPDGTGATAVADCAGSATVNCTYTLTSGRGIFIIPGAHITYHWEIQDTAGDRLSTPSKRYVHEDTRFDFKTLQKGNVTVYYHTGPESEAQTMLDTAVDALDKIGALENTQVTFPVKVFLYETADEMRPAVAPGAVGRGVTVLGEVVYSDTAMVSADANPLDITQHEVAHIVTERATKGPYGIPSWLNEGISVFAQSRVLRSHSSALHSAIEADRVLSIKELSSASAGEEQSTVSLFYGESGAIVRFLVDTYGSDKFAQLIKTFRDGSTPDDAFRFVYGFDQLGLENAWRKSEGLPPRAVSPTPTPENTRQAAAPTVPGRAAAGSGASSGGSHVAVIAIIVALTLALLAAIGGAAIVVARRR